MYHAWKTGVLGNNSFIPQTFFINNKKPCQQFRKGFPEAINGDKQLIIIQIITATIIKYPSFLLRFIYFPPCVCLFHISKSGLYFSKAIITITVKTASIIPINIWYNTIE